MITRSPKGFTLLTAIILSTVVLSLGIALLDIAYKQIILASTAKNSQFAFYAADSALECALYWDQKSNAFDYTTLPSNTITCNSSTPNNISLITSPNSSTQDTSTLTRTTVFNVPCTGGGTLAQVTVTKTSAYVTTIYATGYNTCTATDARRIERGLKVTY